MSAWNMAFRSLRRRRLRTGLTASGIIVGVALMFILLSLTSGMDVQTRQMVRALGGADITVSNATVPERGAFPPEGGMFFGAAHTLNEYLVQVISQIPEVYAVSPQLSFNGYVSTTRITVNGVDPATYSAVAGELNVVSGVFISENDEYKIVLGKAVADSLSVSVGETVTVGTTQTDGQTFTVIGIFETGNQFQEYAGYITLNDAQNITNQQGFDTNPCQVRGLKRGKRHFRCHIEFDIGCKGHGFDGHGFAGILDAKHLIAVLRHHRFSSPFRWKLRCC